MEPVSPWSRPPVCWSSPGSNGPVCLLGAHGCLIHAAPVDPCQAVQRRLVDGAALGHPCRPCQTAGGDAVVAVQSHPQLLHLLAQGLRVLEVQQLPHLLGRVAAAQVRQHGQGQIQTHRRIHGVLRLSGQQPQGCIGGKVPHRRDIRLGGQLPQLGQGSLIGAHGRVICVHVHAPLAVGVVLHAGPLGIVGIVCRRQLAGRQLLSCGRLHRLAGLAKSPGGRGCAPPAPHPASIHRARVRQIMRNSFFMRCSSFSGAIAPFLLL